MLLCHTPALPTSIPNKYLQKYRFYVFLVFATVSLGPVISSRLYYAPINGHWPERYRVLVKCGDTMSCVCCDVEKLVAVLPLISLCSM